MGSGQSSAGDDNNNKGSFSIDPSGKISQPKPKVSQQNQNQKQNHSSQETDDRSQLASATTASQHSLNNSNHSDTNPTGQLSTLNNMTRSDNGLSLQEADEVVTRMKAKYKPNSADMAGRKRSIFEEYERDLLHCYKTHKDHPLACANLSKEYQDYVRQKRAQILKESFKSDSPIAT